MKKRIVNATVMSISAAVVLGMSGCDGSNDELVAESPVSYAGNVPAAGSRLSYTVLDGTIDDGAKPGNKMEIRNGGFGSAAAADPKNLNRFYALTDRGPNAVYTGIDGKGKMFPVPDYTPRVGHFEIQADGSVKKLKEILFKDRDGNTITGLPNRAELGGTGEIPYDKEGNTLKNDDGSFKTDDYGLDSEGLAVLTDGTFWVSDEYGPHMVHFDATGKEIGRINPFADDNRTQYNLPAEFKNRRANRGMEGLTITPDQKTLVGIMQSTMDNPSSAVHTLDITRIVTVDLETGAIGQYLYKQDKAANSNSEIVALGSDSFLVIERDGSFYKETTTGQKHVYKISLSSGTDIEKIQTNGTLVQDPDLGLTIDSKTLEESVLSRGWDALSENGIVPVAKTLVVDMVKENQYPHDKMEGLIVFNENRLGILNDDDFATWVTSNVLEQKYLDAGKTVIDANTLYTVDVNLSESKVGVPALTKLGAYKTDKEAGSEIVAYDKASRKMFSTNGAENRIDVFDIADPVNPSLVHSIDLSPYGTGVNSVAAKNGQIAAAVEVKSTDGLYTNEKGKVVFFDTNGVFEKSVTVGYLPDMVTFNDDGTKVIVANEGEPNGDYTVDPVGSIGIVTVADGAYVDVDFTGATLSNAADGTPVRLGGTPSNDQAKDIEPEYIAVHGDYAYVTLQENNAMAKVNLTTNTLEYVKSYGAKSWEAASGNTIDIEEEGVINMRSYTGLFGLYMPDSIAAYDANGATYVVTANEGDGREYPMDDVNATLQTGDILTDEKKISKLTLDPAIAAEYADENDLKVVIDMGDTDSDGDYDKLYSYGARSFSIWDADGDIVFDSGDEIGRKVALNEPALFNQDDGDMDGRSGNKGAEPEALTLGKINGKTYAFVGLERQNAIMVYDITDPHAVTFVDYYKTGVEGDVSAEGMKFVPADESPNGKNLLLVAYEVSGSTVVYEINDLQ